MPCSPPACRRAVQRCLFSPTDTVWISDDLLSQTFESFANTSKVCRRYGSYVPGPLEARRRLGKRRMAYTYQPTPTSPFPLNPFSPLWNLFGSEVDRTKFIWQAPTTPGEFPASTNTSTLEWLSGWLHVPQADTVEAVIDEPQTIAESSTIPTISTGVLSRADILSFRQSLRLSTQDESIQLCQELGERLKQNLLIGEVSNDILLQVFGLPFTGDIRKAISQSSMAEEQCSALYRAIWEGLSGCKVIRPSDFEVSTMDKFLHRLAEVCFTTEIQVIVTGLLGSLYNHQLQEMTRSITRLVQAWALGWGEQMDVPGSLAYPPINPELSAAKAEALVLQAEHSVAFIQSFLDTGEHTSISPNGINPFLAHDKVRQARENISQSIEFIDRAERVACPRESSIAALAGILEKLPQETNLAAEILQQCSQNIKHQLQLKPGTRNYLKGWRKGVIQRGWLSIIGQFKLKDDKLFKQTLPLLVPRDARIPQSVVSDILLEYWIAQGFLSNSHFISNVYKLIPQANRSLALLLSTINKYDGHCHFPTKSLLPILESIGRVNLLHDTLSQMKDLGVKLPTRLIGQALNRISWDNTKLAYNIYNLWLPMRADKEPIQLKDIRNLVLSMIGDPQFETSKIWEILRIPLYDTIPRHAWPGFTNDTKDHLSPQMIGLLTKMATAFAHSEVRHPRVAFRNVWNCIMHLRVRGAPVTAELTSAITHAGLTRPMISGKWLAQQRLEWNFALLEKAEGKEVVDIVDRIILQHRRSLVDEHEREKQRTSFPRGLSR
ncbi:hypothetical protein BGZ60DRAFT_403643 [Tricladium varicosporioides]|nr:hypothetical protein BGZ60DRAFT_403643 [Hymenoscyphus varicosporioides]